MPETPSANARLPYEIDDQIDPTLLTAHTGVQLVIELFRRVGAAQIVTEQVRIKQRQRGLTTAQLVETLLALLGGGWRALPGFAGSASGRRVGHLAGL